jgi:hypothetical protein
MGFHVHSATNTAAAISVFMPLADQLQYLMLVRGPASAGFGRAGVAARRFVTSAMRRRVTVGARGAGYLLDRRARRGVRVVASFHGMGDRVAFMVERLAYSEVAR